MLKNFLKSALPHLIAVIVFAIVAIVYCKPALEGKVLQQNDVTQWKAMVQNQEIAVQKTGKIPLWTNGMFSGMPAYMIKGNSNNLAPWYFIDIISLHLPRPIQFFFLACVCFYFFSDKFICSTSRRRGAACRIRSWWRMFSGLRTH